MNLGYFRKQTFRSPALCVEDPTPPGSLRKGGLKIANRRFEAIRSNRSHVMKIGFCFLRIDSRESIRAHRPAICVANHRAIFAQKLRSKKPSCWLFVPYLWAEILSLASWHAVYLNQGNGKDCRVEELSNCLRKHATQSHLQNEHSHCDPSIPPESFWALQAQNWKLSWKWVPGAFWPPASRKLKSESKMSQKSGKLLWGDWRVATFTSSPICRPEPLSILETVDSPQSVERQGDSDHSTEIQENFEILVPPRRRNSETSVCS